MSTTATTRNRTARKLLGSLGIVGAAAAVAGMGTFGTFTDSTAPLNVSVNSGTLSIALNPANDTASLPMSVANFVPGDSVSRSVDLVNDGTAAFGSLSLVSTATTSSVLDTDKTNGLQLSVQSCAVAWNKTVVNGAAVYTCAPGAKTVVNGPAVTTAPIATPASLNPNGVDRLVVTLSLPAGADNTFQGKTSALSLTFSGNQAAGTAR
jgi:hypothetical protein